MLSNICITTVGDIDNTTVGENTPNVTPGVESATAVLYIIMFY